MPWSEIKNKSTNELHRQLASQREQLRDARFRVSQGQLKDVRRIRTMKHDIARLMTRLQQVAAAPKKTT